ncbi:MAG: DegT/DnrJ/EryC1/StrS family aminotransferase [Planctomycetota bacterium]|nr:DegT/DnrJ/EryC1/StrS family aminotransferase [Planctomycetota bacterium]
MSAPRPVPPLDLAAEREAVGPALEEAVLRVVRSGRYVQGPEVESFEHAFAELCGVEHAVAVSSGTDALLLGLKALGVGPGDHVVTSPFSFFASAGAIAWAGAVPLFADVDPETGLLDPDAVAAELAKRAKRDGSTRCLLPVHLYGQMCDVASLRRLADEHGLALLEDAAQAHGATRDGAAPGAVGDAAAFSFYPTKNLGAAGEGGLVMTRDAEVAARLRRLRDQGMAQKYQHAALGTNARMHEIQAAVLATKLPHLAGWNDRRREIAARYDDAFAASDAVRPLRVEPGAVHAYHQYTVRCAPGVDRDAALAGLVKDGIGAAVHYPRPIHLQEAAAAWGYGPGSLPAAEALAREVLCLPIHPFLAAADVERVAERVLWHCEG